ncbi:protein NBR1 homolog isoform X2 [Cucurbita pepo subsp. pepo]|uniref:protein NBR1 homolog isoform X2 n=1 Tax=Cucurbita pepo subsp. pepo TaxID=3664 RepID=UPI000C9D37E9|nr:protein NBR1 homolog isoform X2 [Cucurbita pepo subsp. pepo]
MESILVIKVKYGVMLRRLSVRILENNKLDLDINGLRAKVLSLFNFSSDTDFTLTYIDEDGDTVTLFNDDDLHDMMRQQLRFLRIDVHPNQSHDRSNGSSTTPLRSFQDIRTDISEVLKSLPEPLPEICSQLLDIASKALVTGPALDELVQTILQLKDAHLNSDSQPSSVPETVVGTESSDAPPGLDATASVDHNALPRDPIWKSDTTAHCSSCSFDAFHDPLRRMRMHGPTSMHNYPYHSPAAGYLNDNLMKERPMRGLPMVSGPISHSGYFQTMGKVFPGGPMNYSSGSSIESMGSMFHKGIICDGCGAHPITGPRFKSQVKDNFDLCSICFAKVSNVAEYVRIDRPVSCQYPRMKAFNPVLMQQQQQQQHPFPGPRTIDTLKSSGKQTKFLADMDDSVIAPSTLFTKKWQLHNLGSSNWPRGTQLVWDEGDKLSDSTSFEIQVPAGGLPPGHQIDIEVDFTSPPLSGRYLSYWKVVSPSGQEFGYRVWLLIQVDAALKRPHSDNLQALDLNLPPKVVDSNGQEDLNKDLDTLLSDKLFPPRDSIPIAKPVKPCHNLPKTVIEQQHDMIDQLLVRKSSANGQDLNKNLDTLLSDKFFPPRDSIPIAKPVKPCHNLPENAIEQQQDEQEIDKLLASKIPANLVSYPTVDYHGVRASSTTKAPSVSYPHIDSSELIPPAANRSPRPSPMASHSPALSEDISFDHHIQGPLLKALCEMGFKHIYLNKEVLKRNGYNLEKSVDELCEIPEWYPMIQELDKMGFKDEEMNRKLLMKNNGSLKRVVMELLMKNNA